MGVPPASSEAASVDSAPHSELHEETAQEHLPLRTGEEPRLRCEEAAAAGSDSLTCMAHREPEPAAATGSLGTELHLWRAQPVRVHERRELPSEARLPSLGEPDKALDLFGVTEPRPSEAAQPSRLLFAVSALASSLLKGSSATCWSPRLPFPSSGAMLAAEPGELFAALVLRRFVWPLAGAGCSGLTAGTWWPSALANAKEPSFCS